MERFSLKSCEKVVVLKNQRKKIEIEYLEFLYPFLSYLLNLTLLCHGTITQLS